MELRGNKVRRVDTSVAAAKGEITTNTAGTAAFVHDGITPGGFALGGAVAAFTSGTIDGVALGNTTPVTVLKLSGLLFESFADNLTAHAGGGQASALQLTAEVNRLATVATIGDSAKLPVAAAGLTIILINHGANSAQVFGAGADTIDDVAAATGVSQMAGSVCIYSCTTAGQWYSNGIGTGYAGSFPTVSYVNGLTAHAGGGQGSATPITACIARFTTVATAADSGLMPAALPGMQINVANAGANSMNVFPAGTDQINSLGASAAFALANGKTATFTCAVAGQWHAVLSA